MIPNLSTLEYLLRAYWSPLEHPDAESPNLSITDSYNKAFRWLRDNGMVEPCSPQSSHARASCWAVTARGRVYIEHIRGTPLPVELTKWVMPPPSQGSGS